MAVALVVGAAIAVTIVVAMAIRAILLLLDFFRLLILSVI